MWLTDVSIKRPLFIAMVIMALIVLGIRSRLMLLTEQNPNVNLPFVSIQTVYAGAGPEEIETLVSQPIEEAVSSVSRIRNVTSTSQEGISVVGIELEIGTDLNAAIADVRQKLDEVRRQLPTDIDPPVVSKIDTRSEPVLQMGIISKRSAKELRDYADNTLKDRLAKVKGVASVTVTGGAVREILVEVDRSRLDAYNIPISYVTQALAANNLNLPGGSFTAGTSATRATSP